MRYSPEALTAFVETVAAGSFSAAARRLRKSQSTISTSIANLEADLGFDLFDRSARQPVLTAQESRCWAMSGDPRRQHAAGRTGGIVDRANGGAPDVCPL